MRQYNSQCILEGMVIVDRHGSQWRRGPDYQDTAALAHGWMQLQSGARLMSFADVVNTRGFIGDKGERFVVVLGEWVPPSNTIPALSTLVPERRRIGTPQEMDEWLKEREAEIRALRMRLEELEAANDSGGAGMA